MSWSLPSIHGVSAQEAKNIVGNSGVPETIAGYFGAGIDALVTQYGPDVKVTVSGHGHLHNGQPGNYAATSATLDVRKSG